MRPRHANNGNTGGVFLLPASSHAVGARILSQRTTLHCHKAQQSPLLDPNKKFQALDASEALYGSRYAWV